MRAAASIACLVALGLAAQPALAQESIDVPVHIEILNPGDLVSMSVSSEGDLGQIARSASTDCLYEYQNGKLMVEDFSSGEAVQAPGATSAGCAQFGDAARPVLQLSCPAGMVIPVQIGVDNSIQNTGYTARSILFNGAWVQGVNSNASYDYLLTCPSGSSGVTSNHPLELGVSAVIESKSSAASGEYSVNIPVSVIFE